MFLRYFQITRMIHIPYTRQNSIHSKKKICWLVYIFHADEFHRLTHQTYSVKMAVYWPRSFIINIPTSWPNIVIFATINYYFSYFKHYFNRPPPSSSIKSAPLNKARILNIRGNATSPLSSTLWKRMLRIH